MIWNIKDYSIYCKGLNNLYIGILLSWKFLCQKDLMVGIIPKKIISTFSVYNLQNNIYKQNRKIKNLNYLLVNTFNQKENNNNITQISK